MKGINTETNLHWAVSDGSYLVTHALGGHHGSGDRVGGHCDQLEWPVHTSGSDVSIAVVDTHPTHSRLQRETLADLLSAEIKHVNLAVRRHDQTLLGGSNAKQRLASYTTRELETMYLGNWTTLGPVTCCSCISCEVYLPALLLYVRTILSLPLTEEATHPLSQLQVFEL